jgi:hypothetical protein
VNRHFTEEMLALLFRSRIRRMSRMKNQTQEAEARPIYVPREVFLGMKTLNFPEGSRVKRVKVSPN